MSDVCLPLHLGGAKCQVYLLTSSPSTSPFSPLSLHALMWPTDLKWLEICHIGSVSPAHINVGGCRYTWKVFIKHDVLNSASFWMWKRSWADAAEQFFLLQLHNVASQIALFVSDNFADDYQVPFSHPVSQLSSCSRRWEAFPGFQTQPLQSPPLNTSCADRKWRPWMSPTDCSSTVDDSLTLYYPWLGSLCVQEETVKNVKVVN